MINKYYKVKINFVNSIIKLLYKLETICFNIRKDLMIKKYNNTYIYCSLNELENLKCWEEEDVFDLLRNEE